MKKISSLVTGHMDLVGKSISLLDEVITAGEGTKSICKRVVCKVTPKGVRVCRPEDLVDTCRWGYLGDLRYADCVYVLGPFVPNDIHFIQNVDNVDLRMLMLEAWELRNKV